MCCLYCRFKATSSKNAKDVTYHSSKLVLIKVTPAPDGSTDPWEMESVMIRVMPHHGTIKIKNLLQIVSEDGQRLFFVISLIPYQVCNVVNQEKVVCVAVCAAILVVHRT